MLLYPFEEQFDLPAAPVEFGDCKCWQREVVGQEDKVLGGVGILEANSSQRRFEVFARLETSEHNGLIADQSGRAIDWMRVTAFGFEVGLAARNKKAAGLVEAIQALEVDKATIDDVEGARLGQQLLEDVDLVHLAVADMNKGGDVAPQIEQGVQLDRSLGRAKRRPRKHRQAQIDGRRVECVNRFLQIDTEGLVDIEASSNTNQALRDVGVDAPVAHHVGIGQRIARDHRTNPKVIQFGALRTQASFDVPKALPIGQLRERHTQELIQARESLDLVFALIASHAATECRQRKVFHQLRKHQLALVHRSLPRSRTSQGRRTRMRCSNRDQDNLSFTQV